MPNYTIDPNLVKRAVAGGQAKTIIWGETLAAGEVCYQETDQLYYRVDPTQANKPGRADRLAFALSSGQVGQSGVVAGPGSEIDLGAGTGMLTADLVVADGTVLGKIKPSVDLASGEFLIQVGWAKTDQILRIDPIVAGVAKA